jgi:hypothetical protein
MNGRAALQILWARRRQSRGRRGARADRLADAAVFTLVSEDLPALRYSNRLCSAHGPAS